MIISRARPVTRLNRNKPITNVAARKIWRLAEVAGEVTRGL
jgi:hypothetical protein